MDRAESNLAMRKVHELSSVLFKFEHSDNSDLTSTSEWLPLLPRCLVTSTLVESEMYADAGFDDILYGYPLIESHMKR